MDAIFRYRYTRHDSGAIVRILPIRAFPMKRRRFVFGHKRAPAREFFWSAGRRRAAVGAPTCEAWHELTSQRMQTQCRSHPRRRPRIR